MFKVIKITVLGLLAAGLGAAAIFGVQSVAAQDDPPPDAPPQRIVDPTQGKAYKDAFDQAMADQLGISVDQLQAAREAAKDAALDILVEDGTITQEQADAFRERQALLERLKEERDTILADQLGISVDELQAAREDGKTIRDLAEEQGLNLLQFQVSVETAFENRIVELVDEGVITEQQAVRLLHRVDQAPRPPHPFQQGQNGPSSGG
jgi:polyhydroxyalkanoate synthesis regulator phasin